MKRFLLHLLLVFASASVLYPVLWVLRIALSEGNALSFSLSPIPEVFSAEHFSSFVSARDEAGAWVFGRQLFNSLAVSVATAVVGVLISASSAYAFSRFRFAGREEGLALFMLTQTFPGVVMLVPLYTILDNLKLLDSLLGLVLVYSSTSIPFSTWMLKGYFDTLPKELEEAARVDGASAPAIFFRIILPLARPAVSVTALFSFMTAWNEFILAATLLNDPSKFTLPIALQRLVGEHQTAWGMFAAGSVIVSVPVVLLFYALQKQLVGGLAAGAVKG